MAAINRLLQNLSDEQQEFVESWLVRFEQSWDESGLLPQVRGLPADPSLRRPLLVEMVKIDLERQWQRKRRPCLEDYLRDFPELGTADSVPADLIQAEYEVRQQFDQTADLADYARRFPRQAEVLRQLLADAPPSWLEAVPDPTWVKSGELSTLGSDWQMNQAPLPECFGRYRVIKRLGQGGMGAVYLAHDTQLDRRVALKVPTFSCQDDPSALERFYREARAAATLDHPNLCPVHDVGEIAGTHYLTMAYVEGESLAEQLKKGRTFSPREAAALVRKVALAMADAHAHGVIHRDLKPSNIMLNRRGEPVVMDFGLARRIQKEDVRLTQAGSLLGTPAYMPPEQVAGDINRMGPASDVYSLGVILYELLTGRLPFSGSVGEVMAGILTEQPKPPSALRPEVEPQLGTICLKAMARDPADRYAGMAEFAAALDHYLNSTAPTSGKGASRGVLALAAVLLVALLGAGGYCLATFVFRVETKEGVLVVESDENVQVRVTRGGKEVTLIDTKTQKEVPLKVGTYELELVGGKDKLKLKTNRYTIERDGRYFAQVSFAPRTKGDDCPGKVQPFAEKRRFTGFPGAVQSVVFSADGKRAFASGDDESLPGCSHAVRAWDLDTGKQRLDKPRGHLCNWIVLARDGRRYLEGGGLAVTQAYDVDPHKKLRVFKTGPHTNCGAFSWDGRRIILSEDLVLQDNRHGVRVYDLTRGKLLADLRHPKGDVTCVALSPDGKRAFSASKASVRLWDVESGKGQPVSEGAHVTSAEFAPDGKYLLVGDAFGAIRLLSADKGAEIRTFDEKHTSAVTCLAFSSDSKRVVSGSGDKTIRVWDVATGKEIQCLTGHDDKVTAVAFSADGGRLLSGSKDKTVRLWEAIRDK